MAKYLIKYIWKKNYDICTLIKDNIFEQNSRKQSDIWGSGVLNNECT